MGKVCQICGVPGYIVHLVLCSTCKTLAEHRYCMGKRHYMQDCEQNWLCEGCRSKSSKLASFKHSIPLRHTQLIDFLPNTESRSRKKRINPLIVAARKSCRSSVDLTSHGKKSSLAVNSLTKVKEVHSHLSAMRIGSLTHLPAKKLESTKRKIMESAQQAQQQKDMKVDIYALPCRKSTVEKLVGNRRLHRKEKLEETYKAGLVNQNFGKGQNTPVKKLEGEMPLLYDVSHFESGSRGEVLNRCIADSIGSRQFGAALPIETCDVELNRHSKSSDGVYLKDHRTLRSSHKGLPDKELQVNLIVQDAKIEKLLPDEQLLSEVYDCTLEVQTDSLVGSPESEGMLLAQTCKYQLNMHSQPCQGVKRNRSLVSPKEEQLDKAIQVNSSGKDACNQTFHSGCYSLNVSTGSQKSEAVMEVGSFNAEPCICRKPSKGKHLKKRRRLILADEDKLEEILNNVNVEDDKIRVPQSKEPMSSVPDCDPIDDHESEAMLVVGKCKPQLNLPRMPCLGEDWIKGKRLLLNKNQFDRGSQLNLIDENIIVESFGAKEDIVLQADCVSTVQANAPTSGCESRPVIDVNTCNAHLCLLSKLPYIGQVKKELKLDFNGEDTGADSMRGSERLLVPDPDCTSMRQSNILVASSSHTLAPEDPYKDSSPPGRPIFDCTWRGCFEVSNIKYGPIAAHLSSKACAEVICIAQNMPTVLQMTKLPRLQTWPLSFERSPPSDYNIGLYFFSDDYRMENFGHLLDEVIKMDLGLKVVLDDAELLMFPSNVLPESYQRFRQDYYFWGVFRKRQDEVYATPTSFFPKLNSHRAFTRNEILEEKVKDYDAKCKEAMSFPSTDNEDENLSYSSSLTGCLTVYKEKIAYRAYDDLVEVGNNFSQSGIQLRYKLYKDDSVDLVHRGEEVVQACLPSSWQNSRGREVKLDIIKQGSKKGIALEGKNKFRRQRTVAPRPYNGACCPDASANLDPRCQEQIAAKEQIILKDSELDLPRGEARNLNFWKQELQEGHAGKGQENFKYKINFASRPFGIQEQIDGEHDLPRGEARNLGIRERALQEGYARKKQKQIKCKANFASRPFRVQEHDFPRDARNLDICKRAMQEGYAVKGQNIFKPKANFKPRPFDGSCHRCGRIGHRAVDCIQSARRGPKHIGKVGMTFTGLCYSCHEAGHKAAQCPFQHNQFKGDDFNNQSER